MLELINMKQSIEKEKSAALRFEDIPEPKMVCLIAANAGGTKVLHSYLDDHPQLYSIPAYPMLYLYPHWKTWQEDLKEQMSWDKIIDLFCERHASVIDSRKIPATNGLNHLGENKNEHIEINEQEFRSILGALLLDQKIERRTFLLAVHYAYAICKDQDIHQKTILLWHHHVYEHLDDLIADFPESILFGTIRDPRPKLHRLHDFVIRSDEVKLNVTDCYIYRYNVFNIGNRVVFDKLNKLHTIFPLSRIFLIRHEDLKLKLKTIMENIADLLEIDYLPSMMETTFDGKWWWGHPIYNMPQIKGTYERVISKDWQHQYSKRELFVLEGVYFDFYKKYGYELLCYRDDTFRNRILLCIGILGLFRLEWQDISFYFKPTTHIQFVKVAFGESNGTISRKDYSWNATYQYKWTYIDFKLWKKKWYASIPDRAREVEKERGHRKLNWLLCYTYRFAYISINYLRFLLSIAQLPLIYLKRLRIQYSCFLGRIKKSTYLPDLIDKR